jgi:hypothetical protein
LDERISPEEPSPADYRPIHFASIGGATEVASYLCALISNLNQRAPPGGLSALFLAVVSESAEIVRLLLANGATTRRPGLDLSPDSRFVIHRAIELGNGELVPLLLAAERISSGLDDKAMSPLMKAAAVGFIEAMQLLIDKEHDVNYVTEAGDCALRVACIAIKPKAVQLLLNSGANPNITGVLGQSGIHWAAMSGSLEILNMVLEKGADPFRVCARGKFAWVSAMSAKDLGVRYAMVKRLLDLGLPVNVRCEPGSVLPAAGLIAEENPDLMRLFLEHGLDWNQKVRGQPLIDLVFSTAGPQTKEALRRWVDAHPRP